MAAETINVETTIAELEEQFTDQPLTMLDVLGVEMSPLEGQDQLQAATATSKTDYVTGDGDDY